MVSFRLPSVVIFRSMKKIFYFCLCVCGTGFSSNSAAVSFTADAVQTRNGEFNHARLLWTDDRVRFEYLDQGVAMAQIYDTVNKKIIWLDTENQIYLERALSDDHVKQKVVNKSIVIKNPCELYNEAKCTRLKNAKINDRDTVKWLITFDVQGDEQHIFQWLDKKYGVVIKQQNPDGSYLNATIEEKLEVNGRKARKVDIHAVSHNGMSIHNVQWYDSVLNIAIRQVYADGAVDELRNIKVENIAASLFAIPEGYSKIEQPVIATQPEAFKFIESQTN